MKRKFTEYQQGFTLIELMIVVAIIGILAAVAVPKFAEMLRKSKEGSTKGSLTNMRSALSVYLGDNEGNIPVAQCDPADLVDEAGDALMKTAMMPKYMESFPTVKLGQYHGDGWFVKVCLGFFDGNRSSSSITTDRPTDGGAWNYTTNQNGQFWVNCTHTDTKGVWITNW